MRYEWKILGFDDGPGKRLRLVLDAPSANAAELVERAAAVWGVQVERQLTNPDDGFDAVDDTDEEERHG